MAAKVASSPVVIAVSGATGDVSPSTPKKTTAVKSAERRAKPAHPKAAEMVIAAITALKDRRGSSLQAIKKYIAGTYMVDTEKQATFIRKNLKAAVASGVLVQTKGNGASGSFKLSSTKGQSVKPKAKTTTKAAAPKEAVVAENSATAKKPAPSASRKAPAKKAISKAIAEKKKTFKRTAAKPPKPKTAKATQATKSFTKKVKPVTPKRAKPAVFKAKKAASENTTAMKK